MKKKFLAVSMAAMMAASTLVACGGDATTTGKEEAKKDVVTEITEPVTITLWHYMKGPLQESMDEIIADFNASNDKKITVKGVSKGGIPDLNKAVIAAAQSNTLPAMINVYPDVATNLLEQGKIVNLNSYITNETVGMAEDIKNDFIQSFIGKVA